MSTTTYRRVSEATNDSGRVYFQINGIKQSGGGQPTTTLKLKLSGDSPLSALFSHIESTVERSRPPSSSYDRVPKAAEYRWHNMTISPEVDGRRTPLELGMQTGESHVVVIEVVYPVSSPRRYEQSPASARRGVLLDSENDVSYNSNLVAERIHPGPAGRASDMEDARNDARHNSARRIRGGDAAAPSSPSNNQQSRRHTAGVPAGTKRSQSADRVQRTVSDILKDTHQQAMTTTKVTTPLRQAQASPYSPPRMTQAATTTATTSTSKRSNYYEESRSEVTTPVRTQNSRRDSSPVEVRDHLSSMLRQRAQESTNKDAVINAQQAELARLEAELRAMAQSSARPRTPTVRSPAKNTSLRPASPSSSSNAEGAHLSPSTTRRRPEDETHFSAILRQNRTVNTQVMDEEAKAEALAMAIKNQQVLSSASKRESTFQFSKGSTIGSDTQYRHESQWSASDQDQRRREDEVEEEDEDTRHYSERARVPLSPSSSRRLSVSFENQRPLSPVRQHPSEIHPLRTPTGIDHASVTSNGSSAAAAPPQRSTPPQDDLIQLIEDQKKTISSQQEMLLRLEREMLKLAAAQQRNEDAAASTRQPSTNNIINNNHVGRQDTDNDSKDATTINVESFIDESVACSVNVSPTRFEPRGGAPLSTSSTDGTALSAVEERQQDIVRQQQEQLRELEAELAQLRASSSSQQIHHQQQQSSHARREFLQSVITTQATPPRSSPPRSSPSLQQQQQAYVPSPQRAPIQPLVGTRTASSPQQRQQQPSSPKKGGSSSIANHLQQQQTPNNTEASAATSSANLLRQDSVTASKMRATTLENSFLVRQVQIQEYASKESNSRIAILERQLKTQQEKLEITRRQNEVLVAEVDERKRAPRGSLEGKALPGVIPSPYLYHTPARDAAEASQRIADLKGSSSPHGTSHRHHNSVDESYRSLPDNYSHLGSVSPISVGDYSPDRTGQHTNSYYNGPSGANGTVTPVFTQSLSASKYHGDQLVSSRKSNVAPNQEGAPSTTRTPALNETPRRSSNH